MSKKVRRDNVFVMFASTINFPHLANLISPHSIEQKTMKMFMNVIVIRQTMVLM